MMMNQPMKWTVKMNYSYSLVIVPSVSSLLGFVFVALYDELVHSIRIAYSIYS